jgi:hypothetical protein
MDTHTQAYKSVFAFFLLHRDFPLCSTRISQPLLATLHTELVLVYICCRYKPNISNLIILLSQKSFLLVFLSKIHHNEEMFQIKILCRNFT